MVKANTAKLRADTTQIKEDSSISRSGIGRVETVYTALTKMIREMQGNTEILLQESSRNKELKNQPYTRFLMNWQHVNLSHYTLTLDT